MIKTYTIQGKPHLSRFWTDYETNITDKRIAIHRKLRYIKNNAGFEFRIAERWVRIGD